MEGSQTVVCVLRRDVSPAFLAGDICLAGAHGWKFPREWVDVCRENDPFTRITISRKDLLLRDNCLRKRAYRRGAFGVSMIRRRVLGRDHLVQDPIHLTFGPRGYPFDSLGEVIYWARKYNIRRSLYQAVSYEQIRQ